MATLAMSLIHDKYSALFTTVKRSSAYPSPLQLHICKRGGTDPMWDDPMGVEEKPNRGHGHRELWRAEEGLTQFSSMWPTFVALYARLCAGFKNVERREDSCPLSQILH